VTATLRRGVLARLRTIGMYEFAAWGGLVALYYEGSGWLVLAAIGVAVRLAIATESVRCDVFGLHWRTCIARHRVAWDDIAAIVITPRKLRVGIIRGRPEIYVQCLRVERTGDRPPLWVTPSVWTPVMRQGEFVNAAMLIGPAEWGAFERRAPNGRRPSGKRVGRPARR
jgi:hypothetical protein